MSSTISNEGHRTSAQDTTRDPAEQQAVIGIVKRAVDDFERLQTFSRLTHEAIHRSAKAVEDLERHRNALKLIGEPDPYEDQERLRSAVDHARRLEAFARSEEAARFSFLHSLAVVRLWTIREAMCDGIVVSILSDPPPWFDNAAIRHLKGSLVEFVEAAPDQRAEYLTSLLKENTSASLKKGADRFESVLKAVNMSGEVPANTKKQLFVLSQIRNLVVHRGGIVDKRVVDACPWLGLETGKDIVISMKLFHLLSDAVQCYALELVRRWRAICGQTELESRIASEIVEFDKHIGDLEADEDTSNTTSTSPD